MLSLWACLGYPKTVKPISNFNVKKYSGKWHEIARIDNRFEKDLIKVTAEYTLREDGGIDVVNKGFNIKKQKWENVKGKAYFVENENQGYLKVSFFGPFYSSYIIFEIGDSYEYAFVCGSSEKYLWLLARKQSVDEKIISRFVTTAKEAGFQTENLVFPE